MLHKGDYHLSGFDHRMWNLCYSTLERFGCITIFKVRGPDVRVRLDEHITFFVPADHPRANEVRQYLLDELRHDVRVNQNAEGEDWFWSTRVNVELFSGLEGYMTHDELEPMREAAVENFMRTLQRQRSADN